MRFVSLALLLALVPLLAGCGVPDLIAHTVKVVEKRQQGDSPSSGQPQSGGASPSGQSGSAAIPPDEDAPPSARTPAPPRSGPVVVEELPAR